MDLNVHINPENDNVEDLKNVIKRLFEFGYNCVAINTFLDTSQTSGKKIVVPEPKSIDLKFDLNKKFCILNRLTAVVTDGMHIHHLLNSPTLKKYDILAFQPVGEAMLRKVNDFDVDIISLNLSEELGFTLKKTHVRPLINRGKCFEIIYAPCLKDQNMKRLTISNAQILIEATKGKNVIISSGATKPLEVRSIEDIQNLGLLFGLKKNEAHSVVQKNPQLVLNHAGTRTKTGCGFVSISGILNLPKHQGWIVQACKVPSIRTTENESHTVKRHAIESQCEESVKRIKINE